MVLFFVTFVALALILELISVRRARKQRNLKYHCAPSVPACEPNEVFTVYSTVTNLSRHRAPTLRVEEHFPPKLEICEAQQFAVRNFAGDYRLYLSTVLLRKRQRVRRSLKASIPARGTYVFGDSYFRAGDFLGVREYVYPKENREFIVIYPPKLEREDFTRTFTNALDDLARQKRLLEDPLSVCGYREYTGREPLRAISWKQTAVRGELIVKEYDPTWRQAVAIALDLEYHGEFDLHRARQEFCFSMARTICEYLEDRHTEYRLSTNAILSDNTDGVLRFYSSGGRGSAWQGLLYALGAAKNGERCGLSELLAAACSDAYRERTLLLLTTRPNGYVLECIARAQAASGVSIVPLYASDFITAEEKEERK